MRRLWILGAALILSVGCAANPYAKFYTPVPAVAGAAVQKRPPTVGQIELRTGSDPEQDLLALLEDNWFLIGSSNFNGTVGKASDLLDQAREVGAERVVIFSKYTNTIAGATPLVLPAPPTHTTTSSQGMVSGAGGVASYSGTSQSTTTGGYNVYPIPYHYDRYDQLVGYFARRKETPRFGAIVRDLLPEERSRLGRNRGQVIIAVITNSPAYMSDFLRGDILTKIGEASLTDLSSFSSALNTYAGQFVSVEFIRGTDSRKVTVKFNSTSK